MPPPPSNKVAALQYMLDMRHTALGTLGLRPPLGRDQLRSKIALVTGGTGGIGLAAAQALAAAGATVHVVGRSEPREAAAADSSGSIVFHRLDLSTLAAARQLESTIARELPPGRKLDVLVQNLACMPNGFERTSEGHERALSTNLLTFWRLGEALHETMADDGVVVNVVSAGMHLQRLSCDGLRALDTAEADYDGVHAYCVTHRARVLLTKRWAARHPRLRFASVHPGWVETEGIRNAQAMAGFYSLMSRTLRTAAAGADTIAWFVGGPPNVASGSYCWNRAARSIDLPLSGTASTEADVDELVGFLRETCDG